MAKQTITKCCGHTEEENLFGPYKERERKIWWYENRAVCSACYQEEQRELAEQRAIENAAAEEKSKELELPELCGSPKQIAWASSIRLAMVEKMIAQKNNASPEQWKIYEDVMAMLITASWWIDNRDCLRVALGEEAKKLTMVA